mmetsp:Transcript_29465/g.71644  ORF Transcript_29465/g.71644 Transcript_29465/m.71644 type:complete len:500 (-) Transcript_29465:98-1597(-)
MPSVKEVLLQAAPRILLSAGAPNYAREKVMLVGQPAALRSIAADFAEKRGVPVVAKLAEIMKPEYTGSKKTTFHPMGEGLQSITLVMLPDTSHRYTHPMRIDCLTSQVNGVPGGTEVVVGCGSAGDPAVEAAAVAIAKTRPTFSMKQGSSQEEDVTVSFVMNGSEPNGSQVDGLQHLVDSIRLAQALVDAHPELLNPDSYVEVVREDLNGVAGVEIEVIDGPELKQKGLGGLHAVGRAAPNQPKLVILTHTPIGVDPGAPALAFCGKGITYDTGGLALKSRDGMCSMKTDMGGSAACFAAFAALAKTGGVPGRKLHCLLCLAENSIGSAAFRNDDILTMYSGLTVEINNTDAEGRLVLGDGVAYIGKHLNVDTIWDMATLTGAQGVAVGRHYGALVCNDDDLEQAMVKTGKGCGELCHPLPFAPEILLSEFNSKVADLKNSVKNRSNCQVSCAGLFIWRHLDATGYKGKWCHIDMASCSKFDDRATGYGAALLWSAAKL